MYGCVPAVQSSCPSVQRPFHLAVWAATLTGMKLTPEQIAQLAHDAGFRGDALTTAVAVALAESDGDPLAHNDEGRDNSYGLWQINMIGDLGPDRRREHDLDSNGELFDPSVNAEVANAISNDGKDFTPWAAYTNGSYRRFLDEARKAVKEVRRGGSGSGGSGGSGSGSGGSGGSGSGGSGSGFAVDTGLLTGYVRSTRGTADELAALSTGQLKRVRSIADDSFGLIGKESGFAAALDSFGAALQRQVKGVGANADRLATATAKTARAYRDRDDEIAADLGQILR